MLQDRSYPLRYHEIGLGLAKNSVFRTVSKTSIDFFIRTLIDVRFELVHAKMSQISTTFILSFFKFQNY